MSLSLEARTLIGDFALDVAFTAGSGITGLFGPSGAGKTLTLRCIAGLIRPSHGRLILANRVLLDTQSSVDVPARERGVGFVFQQYALFPHLDVRRNVEFGTAQLDRAERAARVDHLLELVGLQGLGQRRPSELSGGQQQRVAIARALAVEPALLLLDEPFAAVDLRVRRRLRDELLRIHERIGTPMLLVTHDPSELRQLADSVIVVDEGKVVATGPPDAVLEASSS